MAFARTCWITKATHTLTHKHTHTIYNNHCISTATMVTWTRLNATLYVNCPFYINNCQLDATQNSLFVILKVHFTCFWCQPHQSSRVHKTVTIASGAGHFLCCYLPPTWPRWREVAVEWTCGIINRLPCVASRWKIINIEERCTKP